jgi:hypothetical protein
LSAELVLGGLFWSPRGWLDAELRLHMSPERPNGARWLIRATFSLW